MNPLQERLVETARKRRPRLRLGDELAPWMVGAWVAQVTHSWWTLLGIFGAAFALNVGGVIALQVYARWLERKHR